jgi:glycosyltransferase involved in cell wall biosynthesis
MQSQRLNYALISPARNEEDYIEKTIASMIGQSLLPVKWVIVSDGSTDRTEQIVRPYAERHRWIELLCLPPREQRHFAGKVNAFKAGMAKLDGCTYGIIGNLDADLSFGPDIMAFLMEQFQANDRLGVAGVPFVEGTATSFYDYRFTNIEHVSGACQLFRRECFEQIGGYVPIRGGGIDWVAVTTARMKGWQTRTFPEKTMLHHRPMGVGKDKGTLLASWIKIGRKDYALGNHPLWELFRALFLLRRKPYILAAVLLLWGYLESAVRRVQRPISEELLAFSRQEQLRRLKAKFGLRSQT